MNKLLILLPLMILCGLSAMPCDGCSRQQSRIFRSIYHGQGPETQWEYLIVYAAAVAVVVTLYLSVKWLVKPGEKSPDHIKHQILNLL